MSRQETLEQFGACWEGLEDPRRGNAALHDFHELPMIALCCVLCGGQGAVDMAVFAEAQEPFLRSFLTLANGLPSHDTFSRLLRNLDPDQFRDSFQRFMAQFASSCRAWWPSMARCCPLVRSGQRQVGPAHGQRLGLRRSAGDHRRSGTEGALPGHGLAALGQLLRHRVSGGDDRGISRRSRSRLRIFRLCTDTHSLRLHQDRGHSVQIGIGGRVASPPLPHHRTCGSAYGGSVD